MSTPSGNGEEAKRTFNNLDQLLRHIDSVQKSCQKIGKHLIENGEPELGKQLIANGFIHDNSKFYGIELNTMPEPISIILNTGAVALKKCQGFMLAKW